MQMSEWPKMSNYSYETISVHWTQPQGLLQIYLLDLNYLMVYSSVPSSLIRSSLFGMVMLWATDFFPLWKKVSGVQILLAIRLLRGRIFIGPWNFNLSSFQLCRKKTSMVYSCEQRGDVMKHVRLYFKFLLKEVPFVREKKKVSPPCLQLTSPATLKTWKPYDFLSPSKLHGGDAGALRVPLSAPSRCVPKVALRPTQPLDLQSSVIERHHMQGKI